jgi:hypothetical protein
VRASQSTDQKAGGSSPSRVRQQSPRSRAWLLIVLIMIRLVWTGFGLTSLLSGLVGSAVEAVLPLAGGRQKPGTYTIKGAARCSVSATPRGQAELNRGSGYAHPMASA